MQSLVLCYRHHYIANPDRNISWIIKVKSHDFDEFPRFTCFKITDSDMFCNPDNAKKTSTATTYLILYTLALAAAACTRKAGLDG